MATDGLLFSVILVYYIRINTHIFDRVCSVQCPYCSRPFVCWIKAALFPLLNCCLSSYLLAGLGRIGSKLGIVGSRAWAGHDEG